MPDPLSPTPTQDSTGDPPAARTAYVGLGSNLGDRLAKLQYGVDALHATPGVIVRALSSVYETDPHVLDPDEPAPPYLNAVAELETRLAPETLLERCLAIEADLGRERTGKQWAPRPLDLDLLIVDDVESNTPALRLPHPRLGDRLFVLIPLAELSPSRLVPSPFDATVAELVHACRDAHRLRLCDAALHLPQSA